MKFLAPKAQLNLRSGTAVQWVKSDNQLLEVKKMKANKLYILLLLGILSATTVVAAPRYGQRNSTDPVKDLERVHVKGKVEAITGQKALVVTDQGDKVTVHLGPQRFWRERGYNLRSGASIEVSGWGELYDEDGGYCYAAEIRGNGFFFDLADSRGYPRWMDDEEYGDDWRPSLDRCETYYGAPPWYWGPPPRYWHRPHHQHYRPHYGPRFGGRGGHHGHGWR
jgi:hypothetical protein